MSSDPTLTVISLGGGVQSSVMALMASRSLPPTGSGGAFDRVPDCAVFADTRWEPPSVYEHVEWLKDRLSFPLYVVDNGRSLREDVKALTNHSGSQATLTSPSTSRDGTERATASADANAPPTTRYGLSDERYASSWDSSLGSASPQARPSSCGWASPPTRRSA